MTKSVARHRRQRKAPVVLPITYGISTSVLLNLQLKARLALDAFRQGAANLEEDCTSIDTLFVVGHVLASEYTANVRGTIEHAQRIVRYPDSFARREQDGMLTNEQFVQLSDAMSYCEALLETSTRREIRDAILEVLRVVPERRA